MIGILSINTVKQKVVEGVAKAEYGLHFWRSLVLQGFCPLLLPKLTIDAGTFQQNAICLNNTSEIVVGLYKLQTPPANLCLNDVCRLLKAE